MADTDAADREDNDAAISEEREAAERDEAAAAEVDAIEAETESANVVSETCFVSHPWRQNEGARKGGLTDSCEDGLGNARLYRNVVACDNKIEEESCICTGPLVTARA